MGLRIKVWNWRGGVIQSPASALVKSIHSKYCTSSQMAGEQPKGWWGYLMRAVALWMQYCPSAGYRGTNNFLQCCGRCWVSGKVEMPVRDCCVDWEVQARWTARTLMWLTLSTAAPWMVIGTRNTALGKACAPWDGPGKLTAHPDCLLPLCQEVRDPVAGASLHP